MHEREPARRAYEVWRAIALEPIADEAPVVVEGDTIVMFHNAFDIGRTFAVPLRFFPRPRKTSP